MLIHWDWYISKQISESHKQTKCVATIEVGGDLNVCWKSKPMERMKTKLVCQIVSSTLKVTGGNYQLAVLLTWNNFDPGINNINSHKCEMNLLVHSQTAKDSRLKSGNNKQFRSMLCIGCYHLSMMGLRLIHISKKGPWHGFIFIISCLSWDFESLNAARSSIPIALELNIYCSIIVAEAPVKFHGQLIIL